MLDRIEMFYLDEFFLIDVIEDLRAVVYSIFIVDQKDIDDHNEDK